MRSLVRLCGLLLMCYIRVTFELEFVRVFGCWAGAKGLLACCVCVCVCEPTLLCASKSIIGVAVGVLSALHQECR